MNLPLCLCLAFLAAPRSDHGDTPLLDSIARPDAKITDLHAFTRGENLVLVLCTNPAIPPGVTSYVWPQDVTFQIHVDNNAAVAFDVPADLTTYGGTLLNPGKLDERSSFRIAADSAGVPQLSIAGYHAQQLAQQAQFFRGITDDPFIRGPRIGRNVASLVIEVPLRHVVKNHKPLVLWATASIAGRPEPFQDLAGRSLRSMFVANNFMNTEDPTLHWLAHGVVPDVMIFDTQRPTAFPNGRELTDDVVDLVGEPNTLATDAPFPSANDLPFQTVFPYLAPPHP
jgi:hypothetical protein